jgi:hypothetical protein
MTPRQKRILAAMATADVVVILAILVVLATQLSGMAFSSPLPAPTHAPETLPQEVCRWKATQLLAQAGLGGTVALIPGESLRFEIVYPFTPDQMAQKDVDEAAQQVWTAFDVALALEEEPCGAFPQVEVAILSDDVRIRASVSAADLRAFNAGELSEAEFIERVSYTASLDNEQL